MTTDLITEQAIKLYDIYTAAVGGKAYDGRPLPTGVEFINDPTKQVQANGWRAVAESTLSTTPLSFGHALELLKTGHAIRLPHWAPDVRIKLQTPDAYSKMTAPYLYVESRYGRVPWIPTQIELLSNNWELADDTTP